MWLQKELPNDKYLCYNCPCIAKYVVFIGEYLLPGDFSKTGYFFFKDISFIYSWETQGERQRHRQREKQAPCREPDAGLDLRTTGSYPELRADAQPPSHPGAPLVFFLLLCIIESFCNEIEIKVNKALPDVTLQSPPFMTQQHTLWGSFSRCRNQRALAPTSSQSTSATISAACHSGLYTSPWPIQPHTRQT